MKLIGIYDFLLLFHMGVLFAVERAKKHLEERDDAGGIGDGDSTMGEFYFTILFVFQCNMMLIDAFSKACNQYDFQCFVSFYFFICALGLKKVVQNYKLDARWFCVQGL